MIIHFDPISGEIVGWESGTTPRKMTGYDLIEVDRSAPVSPVTHRIDVALRELIELGEQERRELQRPSLREVKECVFQELSGSDRTQLADFPISEQERAQWATYRQALRRLSDLGDHHAMLRAWPTRPDGVDPVPHLKERL